MANPSFFIIWEEGGSAPTFKYNTIEIAREEAECLANAHGGEFHVFQAVGTAKRKTVEWIEYDSMPLDEK